MSEYIIDNTLSYQSRSGLLLVDVSQFREEVVRCRNCKHLNIVGKCPCGFWALENLNGFCAWGERESE